MLILTRKPEESIVVVSPDGATMEIHLAKIDNDRAKIGIEAPADFRIFRKEIYDMVLQSNSDAQCDPGSFDKTKLLKTFMK
jgi:carbon storage regulator